MQIQKINFKINAAGDTRPGFIGIPDDKTNLVSVFMNHGLGEADRNNPTDESILIWGVFEFTKPQYNYNFKWRKPGTTVDFNFLLLAMQDDTWSPEPEDWDYMYNNYLKTAFPNLVGNFITGLSAGGDKTLDAITTPGILEFYEAAVPMSPASQGNPSGYDALIKKGIKVLLFAGSTDEPYRTNAKEVERLLNLKKAGTAKYIEYPGGHTGWNQIYDPNQRYMIDGFMMNIYEWMLHAIPVPVNPTPSPSPTPNIPPPINPPTMDFLVNAGDDQTIATNSITLKATATQPLDEAYWLLQSGDATGVSSTSFHPKNLFDVPDYAGNFNFSKSGDYTFKFLGIKKDNTGRGNNQQDFVKITVVLPGSVDADPIVNTIRTETVIRKSGKIEVKLL